MMASCKASPNNPPTLVSNPNLDESKTMSPTKQATITLVPTEPPAKTATSTLPPLTCSGTEGELSIITTGKYQGWCKFISEKYGFSLAIPRQWGICIRYENSIYICPRPSSTISLTVGFRRTAEDLTIQRTGVGAGEVVTEGKVYFLGEQISRDILIYQDKVKAVLYNNAVETKRDNLVFTLSLDDWKTDYEAVSLSPEVQATADKIIESFELEKQ
ncbi:MAG TPA: hypothetical protein VK206_25695 [Anaerolineales bacterium]|nr:hypothetical protein [Anaerolineales bacterium]